MPESVRDRPTKSHEDVFLLSKQPIYYYDADAIREPNVTKTNVRRKREDHYSNGLSHPIGEGEREYNNPLGKNKRDVWTDDSEPKNIVGNMSERGVTRTTEGLNLKSAEEKQNPNGRNKRDVWEIATHGYKGAHFAVMPEGLVEPCVLAGSSAKGCCPVCGKPWKRIVERTAMKIKRSERTHEMGKTRSSGTMLEPATAVMRGWQATCKCNEEPVPCRVLDPFSGAGTVGVVCARYGRSFVGVDLNPEYIDLARQRVDKIQMRFIP